MTTSCHQGHSIITRQMAMGRFFLLDIRANHLGPSIQMSPSRLTLRRPWRPRATICTAIEIQRTIPNQLFHNQSLQLTSHLAIVGAIPSRIPLGLRCLHSRPHIAIVILSHSFQFPRTNQAHRHRLYLFVPPFRLFVRIWTSF